MRNTRKRLPCERLRSNAEGANSQFSSGRELECADSPTLGDFRGVIRHPAMNRLYFLEIVSETSETKSGAVAFRISRS
jgi:hypothetical protein